MDGPYEHELNFGQNLTYASGGLMYRAISSENYSQISKFSESGYEQWSKFITGAKSTYIATNQKDEVYIAGTFKDSVDFDPGPETKVFISLGEQDGFVLKLSTKGEFEWVKVIASPKDDVITAICTSPGGNIFITGATHDLTHFNIYTPIEALPASAAKYTLDNFLIKWDDSFFLK